MTAIDYTTPGRWFSIGVYAGPSPLELAPAPEVANPVLTYRDVTDVPAVFVADPFMVRHRDLWHMFFEVKNADAGKGEIALATSPDARAWTYRGRVLVEPDHLSYPQVFRWRGEHWMVPETPRRSGVRLYRADPFPDRWREAAVLVDDGGAADPTPFRHAGRWWMLVCPLPGDNDVLRLYGADELTGPWREHPRSPIVDGDPRSARPAGPVRRGPDGLIRLAQDCHPRYGTAVRAFVVTRLTAGDYAERPVSRPPIEPPAAGAWNAGGWHHLDPHRLDDGTWIALVDGHDHPSYR